MSCKITLKTPFLVIEAIENSAKKLNVYKETRDGNVYLNNGSFFRYKEGKFELQWEDYYMSGITERNKANSFLEKFTSLYEEEVKEIKSKENAEYIRQQKERITKKAESMGYQVITKKEGSDIKLILKKFN